MEVRVTVLPLSLCAWISRNILSAFVCISWKGEMKTTGDEVRGSCASLSLSLGVHVLGVELKGVLACEADSPGPQGC